MTVSYKNIIALDNYPIQDLDSKNARDLINRCQQKLQRSGLCLLPGFLQPSALATIQNEANNLTAAAHYTEHWRATPNGSTDDPAAEPSTTLSQKTRASMHCVSYQQLDTQSLLRKLYEWTGFTEFINAIYGAKPLYPTADPIVSCMLTMLSEGDELGWHYDPNDGVVSLLIQQPVSGGAFEYAHDIRAPRPGALDAENAALTNSYAQTKSIQLEPGTLSLFNGHRTLHRVAPVKGERARVIALFNYCETTDYQFSESIRQRFFGASYETGCETSRP